MFEQEFGARLKRIREQSGWSQSRLGQAIGLSSGRMISRWELGDGVPDALHIQAICKYLRCSANELFSSHFESANYRAGGIEWRVVSLTGNSGSRIQDEAALGAKLFSLIVKEQLPISEIVRKREYAGFSTAAIRRLLTIALFSGSIQIIDVDRDRVAEEALCHRFGFRHCLVPNLNIPADTIIDTTIRREAVVFLAARDTLGLLANAKSIGLVGGTVISRFVEHIPPALPELDGTTWFSLMASRRAVTPIGASANSVVSRMVSKQPGSSGYIMPFITQSRRGNEYLSHAVGDEREELEHARFVQRTAANVEIAYLSVGTPEVNFGSVPANLSLPEMAVILDSMPGPERERCVGDVLLYLIDAEGQRVGSHEVKKANDAFVFSVGLDGLRRIVARGTVWLLAARAEKVPVIRASLSAGLANGLVVDTNIAQKLLEQS